MPKFVDVHEGLKLPQEAIAKFTQEARDGVTDAFGVKQVELYYNPEGHVVCILDGPDEAAVRSHHEALGVPCTEVIEINSLL
ncbi:MAG: Histidine kinase [Aeromicrobium sp.]|nr:Histidine kinase [Aeromicrobium sp.]